MLPTSSSMNDDLISEKSSTNLPHLLSKMSVPSTPPNKCWLASGIELGLTPDFRAD